MNDRMKTNYSNLDLLRSLAVLSVVAWHCYQQSVVFHLAAYNPSVENFLVNLSFTGVMFFFVHTCLVLMLSMHRAPDEHRGRTFLIRRAFRIYPLCWATIALALATGLTDEQAGNFHALGWRGVAVNLLLVHNILRGCVSVIGPLWSLDWEVQMYLILPFMFAMLRKYSHLLVVFSVWMGASLLAVAGTQPSLPRLFHAAVFPPMFIGGMVAYKLLMRQAMQQHKPLFPSWGWPLAVIGLFTLQGQLVSALHPYIPSQVTGINLYESPQSAGANACICLILALAIPAFGQLRAGWIVYPANQIAKYSYGVYLLHIPALIFVLRYMPGLPLALKAAAFLFLTALLSFVSFHAIENPLIRLGKRLTQAAPSHAAERGMARNSAIEPAARVAVVSMHFSPAHVSHMVAYGRLLREMGFKASFVLDEKYLSFPDFSLIGPVTSAREYAANPGVQTFDIAIYCNSAIKNSASARGLRARGVEVLYLFHEPAPLSLHWSEGWKEIIKLVVAKYCSIAMLRQSTAVLVPSDCARHLYDGYFAKYNQNVFTLPLLFDDECGAGGGKAERPYFSFLGYAIKAHGFDSFVAFVKFAIRAGSSIRFAIATRTDLSDYLAHDAELTRYAAEGRVHIQHGRALSNEEMNQYSRDSFCVWNLYKCSTQSGVLARSFMAGAPVIALKMGSFPEYIVPGVNGEFVTAASDAKAILQAAEKIRQNLSDYVLGSRKTFADTFYYRVHKNEMSEILKRFPKEVLPCASL